MANHIALRIGLPAVLALSLLSTSCHSVSADGKHWVSDPEEESLTDENTQPTEEGAAEGEGKEANPRIGVARQAIGGVSEKICSIVKPSNWRDTMNVPQSWSRQTCLVSYKQYLSGSQARLGCLTQTGFSLATCDNCLPANNSCGW